MQTNIDGQAWSDQELVANVLTNPDNYKYLIERYQGQLAVYVRRISGLKYEDVEDLLQEIFLQAYLNLNDYDSSYKLSTWLYRIAHNKTIDHWRKHKKQSKDRSLDVSEDFVAVIRDSFDANEHIDKILLKEKISAALDQLPLEYREVIVLRYIEDKSYEEMSDILRKPVSTVGTLINRAKKKLAIIIK